MLDVRIASKSFSAGTTNRRIILQDVNFSVGSNEIVALLGPAGTGNTTLRRSLVGLEASFDGSVHQGFQSVGVAFQEPRLLPWLSVAENIRAVAPERTRQDIDQLLDFVQLAGTAMLHPRQLSLGMARRVGLARALSISPDLLVLDEPFASLDTQLGASLFDRVVAFARARGTTILLATHDLSQALSRVTRVLVLGDNPATLLADLPVPATPSNQFREELLRRFNFLNADNGQVAVSE